MQRMIHAGQLFLEQVPMSFLKRDGKFTVHYIAGSVCGLTDLKK